MNNLNFKAHHNNTPKNNKVKKTIIIAYEILIIIWFIGWFIFPFNIELANKILLISSIVIAFPIFLGLLIIIPIIYYSLSTNQNEKKYSTTMRNVLSFINTILFIAGLIILFLGTPFEGIYMVEEVNVLDVRENKILIDDSINNHGDNKIIEINKPFYASIKEGDTINVRYKINKREKMYYVIDYEVGEYLIAFSLIASTIIILIHTSLSIIKYLKKN